MARNKNKKNLDPKPAKVNENSEVKTEEVDAEDNDKLKELESKLLTSLAENENLRKRFDREKEDLSNYVISNFAKEILSVLDNLQRAIASVKVKEVKMRYKIDKHDYDVRIGQATKFLKSGDKVKCTVIFRGREIQHSNLAETLLLKMANDLEEQSEVQQKPKREGRNMIMFLSPRKTPLIKKDDE